MTWDVTSVGPFWLAVAALATWQAVEIWHHSSLFAPWRARTEVWDNKAGELLGCPFCLSVWVAAAFVLVAAMPPGPGDAGKAFALVMAASRLANLGNDVAHARCRTPGQKPVFKEATSGQPDAGDSDVRPEGV